MGFDRELSSTCIQRSKKCVGREERAEDGNSQAFLRRAETKAEGIWYNVGHFSYANWILKENLVLPLPLPWPLRSEWLESQEWRFHGFMALNIFQKEFRTLLLYWPCIGLIFKATHKAVNQPSPKTWSNPAKPAEKSFEGWWVSWPVTFWVTNKNRES